MYDAIIVGARCAGSPLAMLLARSGYSVLLVDRATFPSDTISTQFIWPPGIALLKRWGLLEKLQATGCPPITTMVIDLGPFKLTGSPTLAHGCIPEMYGPRRTVLDKILIDAAADAGAEVAEGYTVTGITSSDGRVTGIRGRRRGGEEIEERAKIVIGADGRNSTIAKFVGAEEYNVRPVMSCCYYGYWSDVPPYVTTLRPRQKKLYVVMPTNDDLTMVVVMFPKDEFDTVKSDVEKHFMEAINIERELADLLREGRRVDRYYGTGDIPNYFRKPYGDGWALAGDAGYHKDPVTAQGISDAFRSADLLAEAIHAGFSGARPLNDALADYHRLRDDHHMPMYDLTHGLATLEPPPVEMQALFMALAANQEETNRYFGTLAGTVPIPEYYSPENLGRIMSQAAVSGV